MMNIRNKIFITILGILFAVSIPIILNSREDGDFIAYWSSARLLVLGGNPYDQEQMSEIQKITLPSRFNDKNTLLNTWNPPWLLICLIPFGYLPYDLAFHIWTFISTLIIAISIYYVWILIDNKFDNRDLLRTITLGFIFGPTLSLLILGQITGIILLSVVLSIYFLARRKDYLIGFFILFTLIKPHIPYFFVMYMFLIILLERRWRIVLGFLSMLLLSFVVMWVLLPNWLTSYIELIKSLPYSNVFTSTFGSLIFEITGLNYIRYIGVLLLPVLICLSYKLFSQDPLSAINFGFLISLPFSPFGFLFDQVVLIPSLVQIYDWGIRRQYNRFNQKIIVAVYIWINFFILLLMTGRGVPYYVFSWIPITLLMLYLYSFKTGHEQSKAIT